MLTNYHRLNEQEHLPTMLSADSLELSRQLQLHQQKIFSPTARKSIRQFTPAEAASFIGIGEGYLRQVAAEGFGPEPLANGRRMYTPEDMDRIRKSLDAKNGSPKYAPNRRPGEKLQVIAVMNFKGGSAKTTTSAHVAQFLALRGYRVLAIDLDPQASLSALFGHQPELDVGEGETLYGAIRYEDPRPITDIVRATYTPNLHVIPGNLELMEFEHETPKAITTGRAETMFFARIGEVIADVESLYDVVVIDCPPQLGFLTMSALCAATGMLITVHPQMLDVMSMSQFLAMTSELMSVVERAGGRTSYDWMRYLVTRYEPNDGPQSQMTGFMRAIFGNRMLHNAMLKSTAISDAGVTKQTLYEVERSQFIRGTYDRAMDSLNAVNGEIEDLIKSTWGR
ncbi:MULTISPECIES: plasmid partitioning protein RepA [Brucella/Ochrobactrum group]|uniref:plasmid partitioning protein RepA n=1 Tax=Brucella/Ochrobactrum group TaxID=2826938 RepID=UPI001C0434DD|nr:plasmid partitioning protein RepA [Brucella sp. NBRC 12950]QWK80711.1 plasmid partitioning protein RepA [Ochrobactrum sp. BTU1]GLU28046.1 plasmid partitioning protein RepA [Brucella sp. NBRC 12950]